MAAVAIFCLKNNWTATCLHKKHACDVSFCLLRFDWFATKTSFIHFSCGALHVGDELLAIDRVSLDYTTLAEVKQLLRGCSAQVRHNLKDLALLPHASLMYINTFCKLLLNFLTLLLSVDSYILSIRQKKRCWKDIFQINNIPHKTDAHYSSFRSFCDVTILSIYDAEYLE